MVTEVFPLMLNAGTLEGLEVTPLKFEDSVGAVIFAPRPDITVFELALLTQLLCRMVLDTVVKGEQLAWRAYVRQYNLDRHFEPVLKSVM